MTTQQRGFAVFSDENQCPNNGKAKKKETTKRQPFGVLSSVSNLIPQKGSLKEDAKKASRTGPIEKLQKNVEAPLPAPTRASDSKSSDTHTDQQDDQKVPEPKETRVSDENMFSPDSITSPMVVSPNVETSLETMIEKLAPENAFDDTYFTDIYGDSHYEYLLNLQLKQRAKANYMSRQRDISASMRSVLVDWLVEVNEEYSMSDETLFLAVSLIDRFLSQMSVVRGKLQLVGTAAIFVAAKIEEIYPPELSNFVYITDNTYTPEQIIRMEALLLTTLDFAIGSANPLTFVRRLSIKANVSRRVAHMAQYICELSLLTDSCLQFLPSEVASAAMAIAMFHVRGNVDEWTDQLQKFSGVDSVKLDFAVEFLRKLLSEASTSKYPGVFDKYSKTMYSSVALMKLREEAIPAFAV